MTKHSFEGTAPADLTPYLDADRRPGELHLDADAWARNAILNDIWKAKSCPAE